MGATEREGLWEPVIHTPLEGRPPAQGAATTHDVAGDAGFLVGPDSAYITGIDLLVGGGVTAVITAGRLDVPAVLS